MGFVLVYEYLIINIYLYVEILENSYSIHSVTVVITTLVLHAGQSWILEFAKLLKQIAFSTGSL